MVFETPATAVAGHPDMEMRIDPAHDEAYIHLSRQEMSWPEMLPAYDALGLWAHENGRQSAVPSANSSSLISAALRQTP